MPTGHGAEEQSTFQNSGFDSGLGRGRAVFRKLTVFPPEGSASVRILFVVVVLLKLCDKPTS